MTLYGDQYDAPPPRVLVHSHQAPVSSASVGGAVEQEEGGEEGAENGQSPGTGAGAGSGGPLTLSSGGQASAFVSYAAATTGME